jgi:rSAM/selenodomain-associated transferase 2
MHLAVVIPTLDEERNLARILPSVRRQADRIVIADGGSADSTVRVAEESGAEVVVATRGRGLQLRAGAEHAIARGADTLLFLHADTTLPPQARALVAAALADGAVGGAFYLRFDDPRIVFRFGSALVNLRTRLFKVALGDQAQFTSTAAYEAAGGFPDWPILEDLELMRRLRERGRLAVIPHAVATDVRRFRANGILRTVSTNWLIWTLHVAGVAPQRLARFYRDARAPCR